ncbi:hypothetical protein [Kitasatospora cineracea]|uniref:Uncharacterized protein n=1 Tax=Kitasatospora cineracea TaxID=88074 RepID=A0A8G1X7W4_9ACTN|nr:hypothetical protein [Kitasatospora cineracea]ROR35819.1 hypothetical protein EDD39_7483 [Kitasatospora cineracea]
MLAPTGIPVGALRAFRHNARTDETSISRLELRTEDRGHRIEVRPLADDRDLPTLRFDAGQYAAELDRAGSGVEDWPARRIGRLLKDELVRRPELPAAWECELDAVGSWPQEPDRIEVRFWHPAAPEPRSDEPFLQFTVELPVPAGEPRAAAAELVDRLTAADPRARAKVCGGRADYAEALGYPWPEDM